MNPKVIIRLGSHAEKQYLLRTIKLVDGLIVGANLIEATPAATASLITKTSGEKFSVPYYVDPMSYAFGTYTERNTGQVRKDLDWIKSDQKIRGTDRTQRDFKRSYRTLSDRFGGLFRNAVSKGKGITPRDFSANQDFRNMSSAVVEYQLNRITEEFGKDPDFQEYAADLPKPSAVFAPYFYAEPSAFDAWMEVNLELARSAAEIDTEVPVHAFVCVDRNYLENDDFFDLMTESLPQTGVSAVWLWFSRFKEEEASIGQLRALRSIVEKLSKSIRVFNLHGGFYSLALSGVGMSGISHGIGYGEQKDVIPVIGQSVPTVRYYLPDIHKRAGVPDIERTFGALGITRPADFHREVCSCVVCKGVVSQTVAEFSEFGEMYRSKPYAKRLAQTPAAAKRCRFHFLLTRFSEREKQTGKTIEQTRVRLQQAFEKWGNQPSLREECKHLYRWFKAMT